MQDQVIKLMMCQVGSMLRQIQSCDATETMTRNILAELVLSPHNSHLSGLCAANWNVLLKEQQAVVAPAPQAFPEVNWLIRNLEI